MSARRSAEENNPQTRSYYPWLSSNHGSDTRSGDVDDLMVGSSWCQGSADALVNVYSHPLNWLSDVPDWPPITFRFNSPPFKMPAKGPFNFTSGSDTSFKTHRPKSLLDIAVPDSPTSSSLHQLLAETTSNDISASSTIGAPGESKSYAQQPATQQRALNPFLITFRHHVPSLGSVIDTLLDDKSSLKLEVDAMGCAHLPASEFKLTLESDFTHYLPIDLTLLLDPERAHLYDFYALATPFITKIAIRLSSVTPPLPVFDQDTNISSTQTYTTSYRGSILKPPPKEGEEPEAFILSKGIYLASNWERIPLGTIDTLSSELEEKDKKKSKRGFTLRAWIPIPTSLFENRETCTFRIDARTWIEDPYSDNGQGFQVSKPRRRRQEMGKNGLMWGIGRFPEEDHLKSSLAGTGRERMVEGSRVVTVSHLQRRRDMP
ncbi:hypothetical protein F5887DRAFT_962719 [Amanita rubescens]|nr:hypothetical protein F5887DRAFT_962719 [Amanita rubescens]